MTHCWSSGVPVRPASGGTVVSPAEFTSQLTPLRLLGRMMPDPVAAATSSATRLRPCVSTGQWVRSSATSPLTDWLMLATS